MHGFFRNANGMLRGNGEIHVNHKTKAPFSDWNLEELASQNSLVLFECVAFKREDYPGYNNKRGAGSRCDKPFPLGACSTFKFRFSPAGTNIFGNMNGISTHTRLPLTNTVSIDCSRIFVGYCNHAVETLGRSDYNVGYIVLEVLRLGFDRYMAEGPGRTLTGYINLMQELQLLSRSRSAFLRRMLLGSDQ